MRRLISQMRWVIGGCLLGLLGGTAMAQTSPIQLSQVPCERPPALFCSEGKDCPDETFEAGGEAVETESGLPYFLDYPCDLQVGEDVTVILLLHGAGGSGNGVRHYFPIAELVDQYRLVVATPTAPSRTWQASDDRYLRNVVASTYEAIGQENVSAFWLVGHSQGGLTANRLACEPFYQERLDGWLSLSGGRIGPAPPPEDFGPPGMEPGRIEVMFNAFPMIEGANGPERAMPGAAVLPSCDMNYIFATGEHEYVTLPSSSPWAEKYDCDPRMKAGEVSDEKGGLISVDDPSVTSPAWGREAKGGTAEIFTYPNCRSDRLVADVIRHDKGHTEGLEPNITRQLLEMMLAAPKVAGGGNR